MATLADLRDALFPDAASVGSEAPGRDGVTVGWVRVLRARVPALDVLEAADLVIVPASSLAVVAPGPADLIDLAQTLARSGSSGLLLVPAVAAAGDPPPRTQRDVLAELGSAAADAGLPAILVHGLDPATLEKRLIGFLVDRRGELERQSSLLEADLAQLAMAARGVESLVAAIASFLRRPVALEGRRSDTIAL